MAGRTVTGRTVTRADLYDAAYRAAGASAQEARELVELVLAEIVDALARDETVKRNRPLWAAFLG